MEHSPQHLNSSYPSLQTMSACIIILMFIILLISITWILPYVGFQSMVLTQNSIVNRYSKWADILNLRKKELIAKRLLLFQLTNSLKQKLHHHQCTEVTNLRNRLYRTKISTKNIWKLSFTQMQVLVVFFCVMQHHFPHQDLIYVCEI